jgi:hypothetical protein
VKSRAGLTVEIAEASVSVVDAQRGQRFIGTRAELALVRELDREAAIQRRSRAHVIREAVARYVREAEGGSRHDHERAGVAA